MTSTAFLRIAILAHVLSLAPAAACAARKSTAQQKPNVLIFLMDDMGYGDIRSLNPGSRAPTPNLDAMMSRGVYFLQAHSTAAVCAPTRYSLLTGNHVYRGRKPAGTWLFNQKSQILPGQNTLADALRSNGYSTAFFGKLHMGGYYKNRKEKATARFSDGPLDHGFDYSLTLPSGIQGPPYAFFKNDRICRWDDAAKEFVYFRSAEDMKRHFRGSRMDNWNTATVGPLLMRDALSFIDHHIDQKGKSKPFFIHYCSQAGHKPYEPPKAFNIDDPMNVDDLAQPGAIPVKGKAHSVRTDMIYEGDVALGLFIDKLAEHGILDDTIIVFASDNGAACHNSHWSNPIYRDRRDGPYGGDLVEPGDIDPEVKHLNAQGVSTENTPLRGRKGYVYEGGHRIPLVFQWNNGIPGGRAIDGQLIGLHDIYRTIVSMTGAEANEGQANDSYDFSQLLMSEAVDCPPVRREMLVQSNRAPEIHREGDRGLLSWAFYQSGADHTITKSIVSVKKHSPLESLADAWASEYYDLANDPSEGKNIITEQRRRDAEEGFKRVLEKRRTYPPPSRVPKSRDSLEPPDSQ